MRNRMFFILGILFLALLFAPLSANAQTQISTFTIGQQYYCSNGQTIYMDVAPFIYNDRVYVPIRYLANSIGISDNGVLSNVQNDNTVCIMANGKTLVFTIDSYIYSANGQSRIMDATPLLVNNRVFLPAKYVAEEYGKKIEWLPIPQIVQISWDDQVITRVTSSSTNKITHNFTWKYNGDDWFWDVPRDVENYTEVLKYYRSKPHPKRTELDFITTYCMDPDDDKIMAAIVNQLKNSAAERGYDKYQTVEFVVAFVQGLPYVTDSESTGYDEYPRYPMETLEEQGGDCEDTAILTATLLREMGYGAALIVLPGHCAVGVKGDPSVEGVYYEIDGIRYYYLETTGQDWPIGEIPEEYRDLRAKVLPLP